MTMKPSLFDRDALAGMPTSLETDLRLSAGALIRDAIRIEGVDAASSRATGYVMAVGDTFNGALREAGDTDWIKVKLQPGTYVITLEGRASTALDDAYLRVMNGNGTQVAFDDDSGLGSDSKVVLRVATAGTYYLEAGSYYDNDVGTYSLEIHRRSAPNFWASDEIGRQLTDGFWASNGEQRRAFDAGPGDVLNVDLSQLTAAGRALADMALAAWESVTGISFNRNPGAGASIHITFDDNDSGAYSTSEVFGGQISSSHVNIGLDWLSAYGTGLDTYSYQTYIHEIGHAMGLGHAGNYNGTATYGVDNLYPNDSWQATVMSYFSQSDNTAIMASEAYVTTAMMADIMAMQDLYGPSAIRTGNNTYGEQTNAGRIYSAIAEMLRDRSSHGDITFTIFDQGGTDRLDMRSDSSDQRVNLAPGGISSAYGLIGNISIAEGTMIEELLTGTGSDYVLANSEHNMIRGGAGRDTIYGFMGNDTLFGDQGVDHLLGGTGDDSYFADTQDTVTEAIDGGTDMVYSSVNYRLGANVENLNLAIGTARYGSGNTLDNFLIGNNAVNALQGFDGNDTLSGQHGDDALYGGNGHDLLVGGNGRDLLSGGAGNDIYGTDGRDVIFEGSAGAAGGIDTVRATATVALTANVENLIMLGGAVQHGFGNDLANIMTGNSADNFLSGNGGNDRLTGGGGADNFVFGAGNDIITDFADDVDTIRIDDLAWGGGARSVAQVLSSASVIGGNAVFDFGNGTTLTVLGVTNIASLQDDLVVI